MSTTPLPRQFPTSLLRTGIMLIDRLTLIDEAVAAGPHFVECSVMGKEGETTAPFKMLGM